MPLLRVAPKDPSLQGAWEVTKSVCPSASAPSDGRFTPSSTVSQFPFSGSLGRMLSQIALAVFKVIVIHMDWAVVIS